MMEYISIWWQARHAYHPLPKKRSKSAANHLLWKGVWRETCMYARMKMANCIGTIPVRSDAYINYTAATRVRVRYRSTVMYCSNTTRLATLPHQTYSSALYSGVWDTLYQNCGYNVLQCICINTCITVSISVCIWPPAPRPRQASYIRLLYCTVRLLYGHDYGLRCTAHR